ncbi:MAG: FAD-binding oxidoreductase [Proteobacteria bacterium]|nr:FAD-binding oxidoreductase [Pseudomonadota bacterium]HQR02828.1 FAD-binding oxidoreductase [Rhodocyclaceae bacterium]
MGLIDELRALTDSGGVLDGIELSQRLAGIWRQDHLQACALVRPRSTTEVAAVLAYCHERSLSVVPQGGLTGLVHGADAAPDQIILSLERMTGIEVVDPVQRIAQVQAGVTLQALQEAAEAHGLAFPLDLGARGTATLGGTAATNAGGNRVIRYGMMRDMVLGIEAVLADGAVLSSLNVLIKNNAGYDLKQLFLGTEGTLGIITRLVLRLRERPQSTQMALVGLRDFSAVARLLKHMDRSLGGALSAFEVLWQSFYRGVTTIPATGRAPISQDFPFYVLVESQGGDPVRDRQSFEAALEAAFTEELIGDAAVASSETDCRRLWGLRDDVGQLTRGLEPVIFDISLPLAAMEPYSMELQKTIPGVADGAPLYLFGHLGDGNLHVLVPVPRDRHDALRPAIEAAVYQPLARWAGSVSAEHGIGLEKKSWLGISRRPEEVALMRTLKSALDPKGILNPGKVF